MKGCTRGVRGPEPRIIVVQFRLGLQLQVSSYSTHGNLSPLSLNVVVPRSACWPYGIVPQHEGSDSFFDKRDGDPLLRPLTPFNAATDNEQHQL